MKKVAIFVEGQTEQIFTDSLLNHVFDYNNINVENVRFCGKESARRIKLIRSIDTSSNPKYLFRIYDCKGGGENSTVKSDIIEQFPRLLAQSFSYIIGIRDVYPLSDVIKLRKSINDGLPDDPALHVKIVLSIKEVEAWFLAEENHYSSIDASLTISLVNSIVGFDITKNTTETIDHPSFVLKQIYETAGKNYRKRKWEVERTVYFLDYENLYFAVRNRNDSLNELLNCLDGLIPHLSKTA